MITFKHDLRAKDTQVFEEQYEESLQLEDEDKDSILNKGLAVWMFVNEELAGESYGLIVKDDVEEIEDTRPGREDNIYCYSTTVLPKFQGQGYGKVLKAYWLGYVTAKYPGRPIIGHSTAPAMVAINKLFGAQILNQHEKWYGTDRVAYFYEIKP